MKGESETESIRRACAVYPRICLNGSPPVAVPASSLMSDEAECACLSTDPVAVPGLAHFLAAPSRTERTTTRQQRDTDSRGKAGGNSISVLRSGQVRQYRGRGSDTCSTTAPNITDTLRVGHKHR